MGFTRQELRFREVEPDDLPLLRSQRNQFWHGYRNPVSIQTLHNQDQWYRTLGSDNQAFIATEYMERIGLLRFAAFDHENRSVGIVACDVFEGHTGKGYATRMMRAAAEYLILDLGYHRVVGECLESNVGMIRALEKSGYKREGIKRGYIWRDGKWNDFVQFSLLECEL